MKLHYISPSILPSRAANSVHVMMQCDGLVRCGVDVVLYAKRSIRKIKNTSMALKIAYGDYADKINLRTFWSGSSVGDNLKIAIFSAVYLLMTKKKEAVLSRNLYASFLIGVILRRSIIYETHQLEYGIRKCIQKIVMKREWITTVVISYKMLEYLTSYHGVPPAHSLVLHDSAKEGIVPVKKKFRRSKLEQIVDIPIGAWKGVCGYFGHLYPGRGVDTIKNLASQRPDVLFLVFGGNDGDVEKQKNANSNANLIFIGYVPHSKSMDAMRCVDVLLMPYQKSVSIGVARHDTAQWMSPMKMFEYLASGVPIISSNLPVLREVLQHGENALLVSPDDPNEWRAALDVLLDDSAFADALGAQGHMDYKNKYTWTLRAAKLIETFEGMM